MNGILQYLSIPALGCILIEVYRLGRCIAGMRVAIKDLQDWVKKIDQAATRADKQVGITAAQLKAHLDVYHC